MVHAGAGSVHVKHLTIARQAGDWADFTTRKVIYNLKIPQGYNPSAIRCSGWNLMSRLWSVMMTLVFVVGALALNCIGNPVSAGGSTLVLMETP